ncbi:MAG: PLP-dependent aminotransferase family protein [Candidatus Obscuribacterales bacterium]|nr:PLP-dependent aminotransferase family protein [Candidatus Obscuribacterales bacterium]
MDFLINVDPVSSQPLNRQIYEELKKAIFTGRLSAGKKVPSTRAMAKTLGVSRATATLAYDYLLDEGYFEAITGSGTYVCRKLPEELLQVSDKISPEPEPPAVRVDRQRLLSSYGQSLQERDWLGYPSEEPKIQFSFGRPDLDEFPMRIWSQLMSRHCRKRNFTILDCPSKASGYDPLKEAIAAYLARARAVVCKPEQVIVVNGSQQGLDLITRVFVDRDDLVGMEEPGYIGAQKAFLAQGANLKPIFIDRDGLRTDYLKSRFDKDCPESLRLLYVTPSHQYPTGVVLSLPRRMELLSFAKRTGTIIVEDDYDSEFRYSGRPIPALAGIDHSGAVIYVGTFSKVLLPALRLGYLVVPEDLIDVFSRVKWLADRHSSLLQQQVLADFISEGHLEKHIRRMRALYEKKRRLMIEMLKGLFEEKIRISGDNAGINILIRLESKRSDAELVARARELGVGIASTRQLYMSNAPSGEFLLNYGGIEEEQIIEGLTLLRGLID